MKGETLMSETTHPFSIPRFFLRATRQAWRPYLLNFLAVSAFLSSRLIPGLIERAFFDRLTGQAPVRLDVWTLAGLLFGVHFARAVVNVLDDIGGETFRFHLKARFRKNLLAGLLDRPAAAPQPAAPGDALNRFNHDVAEVADFPTWIPYVVGHGLFAVIAFLIMAEIDLTITLVVVLPLVAVVILTSAARDRLLRYFHESREADSAVSAFLGEIFGAVQAVKVADAEAGVLAHFHRLNERRRAASLRARLMLDLLHWAFHNLADLGLGVILLLSASQIRQGTFTIGDFSLFVTYLFFLVRFPSTVGEFLADYRTQAVSLRRMRGLLEAPTPEELLTPGPVYLSGHAPAPPALARAPADRLDALQARGLTCAFEGNGRGIHGIDLTLRRGSLTVVTGEIGAGKTTLLRTLLGLLPRDLGEIYWNGAQVDDPASFFVPPRTAYVPQVPRLFSQTLRDNLMLGLPEGSVDLPGAVESAVLEADLASLEAGLDTVVGPRGVRLSGGQAARAAAARAFLRGPELLVFDDLSSALDVETERLLWERLFGPPEAPRPPASTVLAVSHRRPLLRRADQILLLDAGELHARGTLADLLDSSNLMRRLWDAGEK
jgi:ATP-binding cassette subfamily B protein